MVYTPATNTKHALVYWDSYRTHLYWQYTHWSSMTCRPNNQYWLLYRYRTTVLSFNHAHLLQAPPFTSHAGQNICRLSSAAAVQVLTRGQLGFNPLLIVWPVLKSFTAPNGSINPRLSKFNCGQIQCIKKTRQSCREIICQSVTLYGTCSLS